MAFQQSPPALGNQYHSDPLLRDLLERSLGSHYLDEAEVEFVRMGELAGGSLYSQQLEEIDLEPTLTQWGPWGERIDQIEVTPLWKRAQRLAAESGLTAIPYEGSPSPERRVHQFALVYLFHPSTDVYTCPLAMTDGAVRTLIASGEESLIEEAVPRLTSRDPHEAWTSGQWMTELPGGSDVSRSEVTARPDGQGGWTLHGRKWFTSAVTSEVALALARPDVPDQPSGSKGLALFYVRLRDDQGNLQSIRVNRLKDKLGTRKLPTAELQLEGTPARLLGPAQYGTRQIRPMLEVTRVWNAVTAASFMRRGLALARDYAERRFVFGDRLIEKPLHARLLAGLEAEQAAALQLAFRAAELLEEERPELRELVIPLAKLGTARQAADVMQSVTEAFGGAGYVEDTGIPMLLRDALVLPIWEGTTNVLSLDLLRKVQHQGGLQALQTEIDRLLQGADRARLADQVDAIRHAFARAEEQIHHRDVTEREANARGVALTLARVLQAALLVSAASRPGAAAGEMLGAAARIFVSRGLARCHSPSLDDERILVPHSLPVTT